MDIDMKALAKAALTARETAYCPYSRYAVGAAILAEDGRVYTGGNIENASYGATVCAERTALFKAVSEGVRHIVAVAVAGAPAGITAPPLPEGSPCGICRQTLFEFGGEELAVILVRAEDDYTPLTLGELLPRAFGPESLG